jgi:hypothetical protein
MPQEAPSVNQSLQDLIDQIKRLSQTEMSYLDMLSNYHYALAWWKKIGLLITYIAIAALVLTLVLLPPILLLPLVALYLIGIFFLKEHKDLHQASDEKTWDVLNTVLEESIASLNASRNFLQSSIDSTRDLNQTLATEAAELLVQKKRTSKNNTQFEVAVEILEPLSITAHVLEEDLHQNIRVLFDVFQRVYEVFDAGKEMLIQKTLPTLNVVIDGLQHSNQQFSSMQIAFQENLTEMTGLVSTLNEVVKTLEAEPELESEVIVSDDNKKTDIIERAKKTSFASDDLLAMARRDLGHIPGVTRPSLGFFDRGQNVHPIGNDFNLSQVC